MKMMWVRGKKGGLDDSARVVMMELYSGEEKWAE